MHNKYFRLLKHISSIKNSLFQMHSKSKVTSTDKFVLLSVCCSRLAECPAATTFHHRAGENLRQAETDPRPEVGIYQRKQESKKLIKEERKQDELDQESDQEKKKFFLFSLVIFLIEFSFFLVFLLSCFFL